METQAAVVEPQEGGTYTIHSSTQTLDGVQSAAARALGIPAHSIIAGENHLSESTITVEKICIYLGSGMITKPLTYWLLVSWGGGQAHLFLWWSQQCSIFAASNGIYHWRIRLSHMSVFRHYVFIWLNSLIKSAVLAVCERAGGGFGGKVGRSMPVAAAAAVAAKKVGRAVHYQLSRNEDFRMNGGKSCLGPSGSSSFPRQNHLQLTWCESEACIMETHQKWMWPQIFPRDIFSVTWLSKILHLEESSEQQTFN